MILKAALVLGLASYVVSDGRPAISKQKVNFFTGHHGHLSHIGDDKPEHREVYAWEYPSYEFSYLVEDPYTHDKKGQHEMRDGDKVMGSYWLVQPDGRIRTVKYSSNHKSGFHADVYYNPHDGHHDHHHPREHHGHDDHHHHPREHHGHDNRHHHPREHHGHDDHHYHPREHRGHDNRHHHPREHHGHDDHHFHPREHHGHDVHHHPREHHGHDDHHHHPREHHGHDGHHHPRVHHGYNDHHHHHQREHHERRHMQDHKEEHRDEDHKKLIELSDKRDKDNQIHHDSRDNNNRHDHNDVMGNDLWGWLKLRREHKNNENMGHGDRRHGHRHQEHWKHGVLVGWEEGRNRDYHREYDHSRKDNHHSYKPLIPYGQSIN